MRRIETLRGYFRHPDPCEEVAAYAPRPRVTPDPETAKRLNDKLTGRKAEGAT